MDTNQRTANNYQVNTFTKGMNSDTSYDMIGADQYLFGQNIRITNNTLLFGSVDSNNTEMIVAPVLEGLNLSGYIQDVAKILATASIGNLGAIIVKNTKNTWSVYKAEKTQTQVPQIQIEHVFTSKNTTDRDRFSVVMVNEVADIVKIYIADGAGSPICMFLKGGNKNVSNIDENYLRTQYYFPKSKPGLQVASGNLKTQQVQYAYRFYTRHAYVSKLSPLTNKIQVVNNLKDSEYGNAEDTLTSMGFNVFVTKPDVDIFDHVQIFRISYIKYQQQPEIYLVYDDLFDYNADFVYDKYFGKYVMKILDNGSVNLQQYSLDEFSALQTQTITPEVIESNQGYLFCGNIGDNSIIFDENVDDISCGITLASMPIKINDPGQGSYADYTGIPVVSSPIPVNEEHDSYNIIQTVGVQHENYKFADYIKDCAVNFTSDNGSIPTTTYRDNLVSSLMRSLRRDEKYEYGVVYYDQYGRRSNVQKVTSVDTGNIQDTNNGTDVYSLGVQVKISGTNENRTNKIVGFEIVRRQKDYNTTKNLLQVALSRPMRQGKYENDNYRTVYYPNVFLTTQFCYNYWQYLNNHQTDKIDLWTQYFDKNGQNVDNFQLYQIFAPSINLFRNDCKQMIDGANCTLLPLYYVQEKWDIATSYSLKQISEDTKMVLGYIKPQSDIKGITSSLEDISNVHKLEEGVYLINNLNFKEHDKVNICGVIQLSGDNVKPDDETESATSLKIKAVSDVKNPNWENGFSNVQLGGDKLTVTDAIKQYKTYSTTVGQFSYNNWASNGMYDLAASETETASQPGNTGNDGNTGSQKSWVFHKKDYVPEPKNNGFRGWIGPGPVCLLLEVLDQNNFLKTQIHDTVENKSYLGTVICNIQHETRDYYDTDPFFGFGNYFEIPEDGKFDRSVFVFDGDVYNDYAEFVNLFKTYNFNDQKLTLDSGQIVYYIPMESEINVQFDYGYNYRNTQSKNLLLEPGEIKGIVSQDRPLHQYNRVYSDNNTSINVFHTSSKDKQYYTYENRIAYSQLKTNGEAIDNWQIFKPADFIDADSKHGVITNLLSNDNSLYFWQEGAFGKLSVNERSLVTDDNGETVQLGQGGVLQRVDYLSTKYGMRKQDFCAISTEDAIFWIDVVNKAILSCRQNQVANYGEALNVQNLINSGMLPNDQKDHRPTIYYDIQSNELLCQAFAPRTQNEKMQQLVFNTKFNIATSAYTRQYDNAIVFSNVIVGLNINADNRVEFTQYNYLNAGNWVLLKPTVLEFVVNSSASQTKVFDNQKVVTLSRNGQEEEEYEGGHLKSKTYWNKNGSYITQYIDNKEYAFRTDIKTTTNKPNAVADREGNIVYDIPRVGNNDWGDRMRGKWMIERITDNKPKQDYCISHIITKFRQSYS